MRKPFARLYAMHIPSVGELIMVNDHTTVVQCVGVDGHAAGVYLACCLDRAPQERETVLTSGLDDSTFCMTGIPPPKKSPLESRS